MRSSIKVVPPLHELDHLVDDQKNEEKERTHYCTILSASTIQRGLLMVALLHRSGTDAMLIVLNVGFSVCIHHSPPDFF